MYTQSYMYTQAVGKQAVGLKLDHTERTRTHTQTQIHPRMLIYSLMYTQAVGKQALGLKLAHTERTRTYIRHTCLHTHTLSYTCRLLVSFGPSA